MILNQTAEYALRAATELAAVWPDGRLPSRDLAVRANVPASYLSKVMRKMVVAGLVQSERGHHGGFRLTRAPGAISFGDVLAAIEFAPGRNVCAFGLGQCNPKAPCALHDAWTRLGDSFDHWARTTHLDGQVRED